MKSKVSELRKTEFANIFGLKKVSKKTSIKERRVQKEDTKNKE